MRRKRIAYFIVASAICVNFVGKTQAQSAELAPFASIYSANLTGSFTLTGNTNQTCSTILGANASDCSRARNFAGPMSSLNNDWHVMRNSEITMGNIAQSEIFNSSANEVSVPSGSIITKAFLFWFGTLEVPDSSQFGIAVADEKKRGTVLFAGPAEDCSGALIENCEETGAVSTESLGAGQNGYYVAHADVTAKIVRQYSENWTAESDQKSAVYSVGNVQSAQGVGTSAGWSLVVIYANPEQDLRHIEVKSGLALVAARSPHNLEFGDFDSPLVGDITSHVGIVGIDGDAGSTGDSLTIRGATSATLASNFVNASNNVMNSSISVDGTRSTYLTGDVIARSKNTFGIEADRFALDNAIEHGASSVRMTLNTSTDNFYISAIIFATPLGKSELKVAKYISGVAHGGTGSNTEVSAGDTLEYTLVIDNVGVNTATDVRLVDGFADEYLTNIQTNNPKCEVVGANLTCANLGNLAPTATPIVVVVTAQVKPGTGSFSNFATATYGGHQGSSTSVSNVVTAAYAELSADLALELYFTKPYVQAGKQVRLIARLSNYGPGEDEAPELKLTIPAGLTRKTKLPLGCSQLSRKITCAGEGLGLDSGTALIPGETLQLDLVFVGNAGNAKYRVYGLAKTGNSSGDPNLANNFTKSVVGINHPPVAKGIFISTSAGSSAVTKQISDFISDPDLDSLNVRIGAIPKNKGTLKLSGSQLIYVPAETYVGTFTTQYFLTDNRGGFAQSVITIQVLGQADAIAHHCRSFVRTGC